MPSNDKMMEFEGLLEDLDTAYEAYQQTGESGDLASCVVARSALLERARAALSAPEAEPVAKYPGMTFEQVWEIKKSEGYQYGRDALENVRFGWDLAQQSIMCSDCPPVDCPTDKSRCHPCPRRDTALSDPKADADQMTDQIKKEFEEALNAYGYACFYWDDDDDDDASAYHARVLALFEAQAKPEGWIAVSERLPDEGRTVLIAAEGWVTMGWRHDGPSTRWTDWDGVELISPTHWRDLPAPPTQTDALPSPDSPTKTGEKHE